MEAPSLYLRTRETFEGDPPTGYYRLYELIKKGVPTSVGQPMLNVTVHLSRYAMDLPPIERQTDAKGLCDQRLCPDSPEDGGRCDHCPLTHLDIAEPSECGIVIRCALDLMNALKLGVHISLDDIAADEFQAMLIIAQERDLLEREKLPGHHG